METFAIWTLIAISCLKKLASARLAHVVMRSQDVGKRCPTLRRDREGFSEPGQWRNSTAAVAGPRPGLVSGFAVRCEHALS